MNFRNNHCPAAFVRTQLQENSVNMSEIVTRSLPNELHDSQLI